MPRSGPLALAAGLLAGGACHVASAQEVAAAGLAGLDLDQLARVRVTSVSLRPQSLRDAAASIYVITGDAIRRSAATRLPEALRLAPNLEVAQLNAGQYAISARGFNNAIGNKLLVLIDGRTVYSPLFSGVFWDANDVPLDDIERIEVISGPGATLWGANAVNGVINVVTRKASATQGTLLEGRAGGDGALALARHGGPLAGGAYRVYAMRAERDATERPDGRRRADASGKDQLGFRADWDGARDDVTLQGDAYQAGGSPASNLAPVLEGANLLARWERQSSDGSIWQWQAWVDHERRDDDVLFKIRTDTIDLQFNHAFAPAPQHRLVWGAGYRRARSEGDPNRNVLFDPAVRELSWSNAFVQDDFRVAAPLTLTAGAKVETNSYTGTEFLPTLRAALRLPGGPLAWASLSRAVRAPARIDRDFFFPARAPFVIRGGPAFVSETANVAELGLRAQPTPALGWSLTAFHAEYGRLRGGTPPPTFIENRGAGHVEGLEGWISADLRPWWRLAAGWLELRKSLHSPPGSSPTSVTDLGNDPDRQWSLRSSFDLGERARLDVAVRHVGALPAPAVEAYTATDLRLDWQATPTLTLGLAVQNAFDPGHVEFNAPAAASVIPRSAWLSARWRLP